MTSVPFNPSSPTLSIDQLLRIRQQDLQEFETQAIKLAEYAIHKRQIWTVYRLARELQNTDYDLKALENCILECNDPFFILRYARDIKTANIAKLQEAIIKTRRIEYIAEFGCFVNGADLPLIEDLIVQYKNPRAAYLLLSFAKHPNVDKVKHIILKSKRPRYLYCLAKLCRDPEELELIQDLILRGKSLLYVRLFCAYIPGADLRKCEDRILQTRDMDQVRKFVRVVHSERLLKLLMLG